MEIFVPYTILRAEDLNQAFADVYQVLGEKADADTVSAFISQFNARLDEKVEKIPGFGLSQENFTLAEKLKLAGLESSKFKGVFQSLGALTAAVQNPQPGDYADVDEGPGEDVARYIWDPSDGKWVKIGGAEPLTASQVKILYEMNPDTNVFSDADRVKLDSIEAGAQANPGEATHGSAGLLSASDKAKIDGVEEGATKNAIASVSSVRASSGDDVLTPGLIASASAPAGALSGTSSTIAVDWGAFIYDSITVNGNRTIGNPTNVTPGTTRAITLKGNSGTLRTVSFGSSYKGPLPTVNINNANFITLYLFAVSANEILVNAVHWP